MKVKFAPTTQMSDTDTIAMVDPPTPSFKEAVAITLGPFKIVFNVCRHGSGVGLIKDHDIWVLSGVYAARLGHRGDKGWQTANDFTRAILRAMARDGMWVLGDGGRIWPASLDERIARKQSKS